MRKKLHDQLPIAYPYIDHEHAREFRRIDKLIDDMPLAGELVYQDLVGDHTDTQPPGAPACPATRSSAS